MTLPKAAHVERLIGRMQLDNELGQADVSLYQG